MSGETWKERARRRRDERQTKVVTIRPPASGKRDTKKWCRGVVGRKHQPLCVDYADHKHTTIGLIKGWKLLICTECKKELDYHWPTLHGPNPPPPTWVTP